MLSYGRCKKCGQLYYTAGRNIGEDCQKCNGVVKDITYE